MWLLRSPIVLTLLIVGAVVSSVTAGFGRASENRDATRWLDERADLIVQSTNALVANTESDLAAVRAFMSVEGETTQEQFKQFVDGIDLDPGIAGVAYISVVRHADLGDHLAEVRRDIPTYDLLRYGEGNVLMPAKRDRDTYYPVRYLFGGPFLDQVMVEKTIDTNDALGFDIASDPDWRGAIEDAAARPATSVTGLLDIGGGWEMKAFGVTLPVFDDSGATEGFLLAPGLDILLTQDLGVSMTRDVEWSVANPEGEPVLRSWPEATRRIEHPGSTWELVVRPTDEVADELIGHGEWVVLVLGFGLTLLVVTLVHQMGMRRRERVEIGQLRRLSEDKNRFLAAVSHEIRTPLTAVTGLAHELVDHGEEFQYSEARALLELIAEQGDEVAAIVEDLLIAARSDIGKVFVRAERIVWHDLIAHINSAAGLDPIRITGDQEDAWADPQRVRQILRNLMTNADRYGGSNVEIRFDSSVDQVIVTVADDGDPIPVEEQQQIFDPYTSAHAHGIELGSIGLGLFISRRLANLMSGDLIYRHDGTHSLFELRLPRHKTPDQKGMAAVAR